MDAVGLTPFELSLVRATQDGLPIRRDPYRAVAERLGVAEAEVMAHLRDMLARGVIRRIGAVPNHYALGFVANGMTVWDVDDGQADAVGAWLGQLADVSHCYRRPRRPPQWRYNLFAMLHGTDRAALLARIAEVAEALAARFPGALRAQEALFSSAILKKTGLRLRDGQGPAA
ncbi:Lrp/AsnC family transcriptional regulator [Achromobacter pestifer]|uniref:siroheme decarboxylase n=1 Tax=Achromobacter pestifer TaxID=1353889 RepID=A0A7D4I6F3_9BURK|nr:Lrp/AsnC family transcriptional regulator [Achromobacter pestifer]QKH34602.1 Lrp/AsnC family transcriptional regulator [Achromobacter pestifer]